jgi:glyoxylase-like metal-dependent hydrolase (beta-lactamase superfamily II)
MTWQTGITRLGDGIYAYIQEEGTLGLSNAGLIVGKDHVAVVDTLNSVPAAQAFLQEVRIVTDKEIRYIINTHSHPDHIWGNHLIPGAIAISHHKACEEMKQQGRIDMSKMKKAFADGEQPGGPGPEVAKVFSMVPDLTFDDTLTIRLGGKEIRLLYYGFAHSLGDIAVHLPEERIVFCGDLLFQFSTPMGFGGSFPGWIEALGKIADLDADTYVPGHGPLCNREGLLRCREYLTLVHEEARKAFDAGLSYREAAAGISLGEFREWKEPERLLGNVARIYQELKGENLESPIDVSALIMEVKGFGQSGWLA